MVEILLYFPNKITFHQIPTIPMMPINPNSTSKLKPTLHFRYSITIEAGLDKLLVKIALIKDIQLNF